MIRCDLILIRDYRNRVRGPIVLRMSTVYCVRLIFDARRGGRDHSRNYFPSKIRGLSGIVSKKCEPIAVKFVTHKTVSAPWEFRSGQFVGNS